MKKFLLSLSVAMLSVVGAWAQEIDNAASSDEVGATVRRLEITLSGDWLNGESAEKLEQRTTMLIDLVMGYVDGAFDADQAYTEVTIKSAEGTTVTVNQSLLQQLVTGKKIDGAYYNANNKIKRLDLRDVAVTHYVGHDGSASKNANATFYTSDSTCPIEYLAMPSFDETVAGQTYSIPPYTIAWMAKLDEVVLPKNTKTVEHEGFAGVNVPTVKLNMGLEFIGNSAFYASSQISKEATLDVPSTVKYIGPGAFNFRNFSDIYFHSAQAPICPTGKVFADTNGGESCFLMFGNYTGWGGISYTANKENGGDDYKNTGVANRMNYNNNDSYWFTMIHFPASADVPNLDISSYKDETRVYNKVYGTVYYDVNNDKGNLEIGVPGKEQEYIAREKVWAFQGAYDFVGQETTALSYDGQTTGLAPSGFAAIPAEAVGKGVVDSGFEDTYRGLNYIWPCQTQYNRAYATVANGVNWDGVTKYRPVLTPEQYELMVKDGLIVKMNGTEVTVGQDITYDDAMANAYNATLQGAVHEGEAKDWYTADEALEYNAKLEGAKQAGDKYSYTDAQAYAYNANLQGAVKEGDVETTWTADDANAYNATLPGAWQAGQEIHPTAEEVLAHNANFDGAKKEGDVEPGQDAVYMTWEEYQETDAWKNLSQPDWWFNQHGESQYNQMISDLKASQWANYSNYGFPIDPCVSPKVDGFTYTAEQAAAYNAAHHPDPWTTNTVLRTVTAEEAIAHNAALDGAKHEGEAKTFYSADAAKTYNQTLPGAVTPGSYVEFTAETAAAFNATLPGAVKEGDVKETWTADAANAHNAELTGARAAGFTSKNYADPALEDYLRMIAFQSTRRCVFADNAGGGDHYDVKIPYSQAWWTICLPFDLTKAQIDKYFGVGTHVCLFNQVDRDLNPASGKPFVKFYFTDDQYSQAASENSVVLQAHVPYMIFPTISDNDAVYLKNGIPMSEYTIKPGSPVPTVIEANAGKEVEDHSEYRFIGNYDTKLPVVGEDGKVVITDVVVPQYSYIYAKKATDKGHTYKFWFTQNGNIPWGANKCIIQSTAADRGLSDQDNFFNLVEKDPAAQDAKQITILYGDDDNDEANAIDVIIVAGDGEKSEVIYNLNGQMLNGAPQRGVYIKNGKKYIAK